MTISNEQLSAVVKSLNKAVTDMNGSVILLNDSVKSIMAGQSYMKEKLDKIDQRTDFLEEEAQKDIQEHLILRGRVHNIENRVGWWERLFYAFVTTSSVLALIVRIYG